MEKARGGGVDFRMLAIGGAMLSVTLGVAWGLSRGDFLTERSGLLRATLDDAFESGAKEAVYEVALGEESDLPPSSIYSVSEEVRGSGAAPVSINIEEKADPVPKTTSKTSPTTPPPPPPVVVQETSVCVSSARTTPTHELIINEIAWMGTLESAQNEWIELKNLTGRTISLSGSRLINDEGTIEVRFGSDASLPPGAFFLLERTDDASVPAVAADAFYTGNLGNSGERLALINAKCELVDEIDALSGWGTYGGDNATKQTLERNIWDFGWHTSITPGGTPRAENSDPTPPPLAGGPPPAPQPPPPPPGGSPPPPPPPQQGNTVILISEIMAGADGNADYEFIELYNPGDTTIDLSGWELRKRTSTGSESNLVDNAKFTGTISAHGYFLIASPAYTGTPSPNLVYSVTSASLAYTNNAVILYRGDHALASVADEISWIEIPKDQSYERDLLGGLWSLRVSPTPERAP